MVLYSQYIQYQSIGIEDLPLTTATCHLKDEESDLGIWEEKYSASLPWDLG